jgi:glycosyltransferase involved in cell wall biosynthesis
LRVLHLHSGNTIGGIESMLATMAECRDLCPQMEQHFALLFDSNFAATLRRSGAPVHLLPQARLRHIPSLLHSRYQLKLLLSEQQFDVVIAHSTWTQLIFAEVIRRVGIKQLLWMHGPCDGHWLQKLASFQPPDFVICNSEFTRSTVDRCYRRVPNVVIHCPVKLEAARQTREEVRAELGLASNETAILIAARMEPWKGHLQLIRTMAAVRTQNPWRLLIAGAPSTPQEQQHFNDLRFETETLHLTQKVHFLGYRSDVSGVLLAAELYCQPNQKPEPFGVVFVEALHRGVLVVTSAMGGAREILTSETGILLPPDDSAVWLRVLTELIDHPESRTRLSSEGPARAAFLCGPKGQMEKLNETLQSVIVEKRGASR